MKTKTQFVDAVREVRKMTSKTGTASYSDFSLEGAALSFKRDNTGKYWKLDIDEVYRAYTKESFINTVILRKYISSRVFSPSLALLIKTGFCDAEGNRLD
jgi:hypothetical protein